MPLQGWRGSRPAPMVPQLSRKCVRIVTRLLPLLLLAACTATTVAKGPATAPAASTSAAVSAADPRAAEAGRQILAKGGSAVDAAAAVMLALTVVEPQSSGIGGGSFIVYHDAKTGLSTYDGREEAPASASPTWFLDAAGQPPASFNAARAGGRSVGVPGNLANIAAAHKVHGKLPWAALFEPAIRLARDGFAVTPRFLGVLEATTASWRSRPRRVRSIIRPTAAPSRSARSSPIPSWRASSKRWRRTVPTISTAAPAASGWSPRCGRARAASRR